MDKNPEVIQKVTYNGTIGQKHPAPVFLIHDGGGTTFTYHCLDSLERQVYGIFNPYFRNGGTFEGGVRGMGRLYAGIIKRTCAESDFPAERNPDGSVHILLGGWSMGGLLSLEVAKFLIGDHGVKIIGILMMDSIYPIYPPTVRLESLDHLGFGKSKNEFLSLEAMREALRMIEEWKPPIWHDDQVSERPRISLLRGVDSIPTGNDKVHITDIYRHERALGWDQYDKTMFTEVIDVPGDHFEILSFGNIPDISVTIKTCLDKLDTLGSQWSEDILAF